MTALPDPARPGAARSGAMSGRLTALDWWLDGGVLGPVRRLVAAIVVAVGPWIVFVATLAIISMTSAPALGRAGLQDLRLTVTYAFCFAPMAAGPVGLAAAELARCTREEALDLPIYDVFRVALALSGVVSAVLALAISMFLNLAPFGAVSSYVLLSAAAAMLWVCFATLSALRSFRVLIMAFLGGITLAIMGTVLVVRFAPSIELLLWCFAAGLIFCVAVSLNHVQKLFAPGHQTVGQAFILLRREIWRRRMLSAGVTLALLGIWADKWVFWLGPDGMLSAAGFRHFSRYDSVMFVAHLSMIPTFSAILLLRERELSVALKTVQGRMQTLASRRAVAQSIEALAQVAWTGGFRLLFVQATIAGMLILAAPWIARGMSFDFQQFLMLRVAIGAVFFFSVAYVGSILILMCGRARHFLLVQAVFFLLNLGLSVAFITRVGVTAYPIFLSSLITAIVAWPIALKSIAEYDFLYMLGENESLYDA